MIKRPDSMGKFEFAVLASLRAGQLARGCMPRVDGDNTTAVIAQREVAEGKVTHAPAVEISLDADVAPVDDATAQL
ncbi:MAG: DNA-directed RNA polymerase subunit omega [Vicinamibacterales bacterium]